MSLSRPETLQSTPPFFQLIFLLRLKIREICCNSFNMIGRAFCGNGFIHLNIAEFYEGDIGARKHARILAISAQNERFHHWHGSTRLIFLKTAQGSVPSSPAKHK